MPLRITPENAQPAEPLAVMPPPASEMQESGSVRSRRRNEQRAEGGHVILKIVIGGIFAYIAVMAVGLCGMMFPHQAHEVSRSVQQAISMVRPETSKPRVTMVQATPAQATPAAKAVPSRASRAPRPRVHVVPSSKYPGFEVVDTNHRYAATPRPPTPSVTVSVVDTKQAGSAAN